MAGEGSGTSQLPDEQLSPSGTQTSVPAGSEVLGRGRGGSMESTDEADMNSYVIEMEEAEVEAEDTQPLRIGDYVTIRGLGLDGVLCAEGILEDNCTLTSQPARYDDCVFQICLKNQYSAARELDNFIQAAVDKGTYDELMAASKNMAQRIGAASALFSEGDEDEEAVSEEAKGAKFLKALRKGKLNEQRLNGTYMDQQLGSLMEYGQVIQLRHRKSQKYLTVDDSGVANVERDNLRVYLSEDGSALSWLSLSPYYKIDREGEAFSSNAAVYLRVAMRPKEAVRHSSVKINKNSKNEDREINCSLEASGWRICLHSSYYNQEAEELYAGEIVSLYDPLNNAYLQLMEVAGQFRIDCYLHIPAAKSSQTDSNFLWVLERHKNPSHGGKVTFGKELYRFRHLNTGKYLCCRSENSWKMAKRMIQSVLNMNKIMEGGGGVSAFGAEEAEKYIFASMGGGGSQSCAIDIVPAHEATITRNAHSGSPMYITDNSAIKIQAAGQWLHRGERFEGDLSFKSLAHVTKKECSQLVIRRFVASPSDTAEIMVGVAAIPFLKRYFMVVHKHQTLNDIWMGHSHYIHIVNQLINFVANSPLNASTDYEALEMDLTFKGAGALSRRKQDLLREQGVVNAILNVLKEIVSEKTMRTAAQPPKKRGPGRPKTHADFEQLKRDLAGPTLWLLRLCILDNEDSQMLCADYLSTLITYVPIDVTATTCLVHMLSTNVELQETKVTNRDIENFIAMIRRSKMDSNYLNLLKATCSCKGKGIDGNQCRVVDLWLEGSDDLSIGVIEDPVMGKYHPEGVRWGKALAPAEKERVLGKELLSDGLSHLMLSWKTNHEDLTVESMGGGPLTEASGPGYINIKKLFDQTSFIKDITAASNVGSKATVQKYFVSQLNLAAEICLDRNYLAMDILRKQFPYPICITMLKDPKLPNVLKAATAKLMNSLYVDEDPQCEMRLPRLSHPWDDLDITSPFKLPAVPEDQKYKFFLLQEIIREVLEQPNGVWDDYTQSLMEILLRLVRFRFYSDPVLINDLVGPLVASLDCRQQMKPVGADAGGRRASKAVAIMTEVPEGARAAARNAYKPPTKSASIIPEGEALPKVSGPCINWPGVYDFLDGLPVLYAILTIVIIGLTLSIIQMTNPSTGPDCGVYDDDPKNECEKFVILLFQVFEHFASAVFFVELNVRMFAYSVKFGGISTFANDVFAVIDILIVLIDVIMYGMMVMDMGNGGGGAKLAKSLRMLRMVRLFRVMKAAKIVNKLSEEVVEDEDIAWELPLRYRQTPARQLESMLQVIEILGSVALFTRDFTLGTVLTKFKRTFSLPHDQKPTEQMIFRDAIADAAALSLTRPGQSIDDVFLDIVMYEHSDLVQAALNVLMVQHSTRKTLLQDVSEAQLLISVREQKEFHGIKEDLMELQSAAEKHELWGELQSEDDHALNERTKRILRVLAKLCRVRNTTPSFDTAYGPCKKTQDLIRNLGGFETAMTVLDLYSSIAEAEEEAVRENTTELLRLSNIFLSWFLLENEENQVLAFDHIDFFIDTLDDGIQSANVLTAILKGNPVLVRAIPLRTIGDIADRVVKVGYNPEYLSILEAMVFIEDFEGDNNVDAQFAILEELSRSSRKDVTMYLCADPESEDYAERREMMQQAQAGIAKAMRASEDVTLSEDWAHIPHKLAYHCKLLDVLAGTAVGRTNITTVETKLQTIYQTDHVLHALLDPATSLDVAGPLAAFFFHVVVEVEIKVPGLENQLLMWEFLERIPKHLNAASSILSQPLERMACAGGAVGIKSRQQLFYTWFCIRIFTVFFKNYYSPALLVDHAEALAKSPTSMNYFQATRNAGKGGAAIDGVLSKHLEAQESGGDQLDMGDPGDEGDEDLMSPAPVRSTSPGGAASLEEENDDIAFERLEDEWDLENEMEHEEAKDVPQKHWIHELIESLHSTNEELLRKHQAILNVESQQVLIEGLGSLRGIQSFPNAGEIPGLIQEDDENDKKNMTDSEELVHNLSIFSRRLNEAEGSFSDAVEDERTLDVLEVFESLPTIHDPHEADLRFEPLIHKLVEHARSRMVVENNTKKLDQDCTTTTIWIIQLFRAMIEKAWGMTIEERDEDGGEEQDDASEHIVRVLNKYGATTLCLDLIAVGIDSNLVLEAIKLCVAMLFREGGNTLVQETINEHLVKEDSTLFFHEVRKYMERLSRHYEFDEISAIKEDDEPELPETLIVMRFLQLMSEGHYEPNQDIMRQQQGNHTEYNLLDDMVKLLSDCSRSPSREACNAAQAVADSILEIIQGPCTLNQEKFALNTELIEIMNRMLRAQPTGDVDEEEDEGLKCTLLEIFEGLTEGQGKVGGKGSVVFERILSVIDLDVLQVLIMSTKQDDDHGDEMSDIQTEGLVLLQMFCDYNPSLRSEITLPKRIMSAMGTSVQSVEVVWNGKLQRRFFPVPEISDHIAEATRQKLVSEIDRTSQDAKLQDFLSWAHDVYGECEHQEWLSSVDIGNNLTLASIFSRTNQEAVTWLSFFCALTINIVFLCTYAHTDQWKEDLAARAAADDYPGSAYINEAKLPMEASASCGSNLNPKDGCTVFTPAEDAVLVLNIMNIGFSAFVLGLYIIVRCPVKYRKLIEHGASEYSAVLQTATDQMTMYYACYTILAIISMLYDDVFHPLLLLDIIVKDSTTRAVIDAVVIPIKQLAATLLLTLFVIYIFSMIVFKNFAAQFASPDSMDDCETLWKCFLASLNYGMRLSGGIGDIMSHTLDERLMLDLMYFLIVLVILLNIVFGIIIDTFSDLRNKKLERLNDTTERCFICGMDRFTFDSASNEPQAFRKHLKKDHYMWNYLNFIFFIWQQDRDDDDGLELYVRKLIEKGDIMWLPKGRAMCLTNDDEAADESIEVQLARVENDIFVHMNMQQAMNMQMLSKNANEVHKIKGDSEEMVRLLHQQIHRDNQLTRKQSEQRMNEKRATKLGITPQGSPSHKGSNSRPGSGGTLK